jgi:hypothetical protein
VPAVRALISTVLASGSGPVAAYRDEAVGNSDRLATAPSFSGAVEGFTQGAP